MENFVRIALDYSRILRGDPEKRRRRRSRTRRRRRRRNSVLVGWLYRGGAEGRGGVRSAHKGARLLGVVFAYSKLRVVWQVEVETWRVDTLSTR
ncbi:hypothetical protein SLEP1_g60280 [Rubroshorea leprosula]|uniref:Uncharacterized protein n=1 Tax=Rubroshorea leprosula TaxID=152421 RepID=A0AAV5MWA3_9ROSI|nr:hypothetical protein SLEP1_g60280 [Rubroshorea leprosula]